MEGLEFLCFKFTQIFSEKEKPLIIVDDYKFRYDYHILSKFFTIKIIGRSGVLENF